MSDGNEHSGWRLLRQRNIGLLWWGQVVSQVGDSLNKVALLWFVYSLTGSALKMTVVGLLQTLPPLVLGPLIGVYIDRLPKKTVLIVVDLLRTVLVALIPLLYALDLLPLDGLYVLVFLTAVVSTVFGPALASTVPDLVRPSQLTAANALLQSTANVGLLVGPALSGIGIALVGAQYVLYLDALTFLLSAVCLMGLRLPPRAASAAPAAQAGLLRELAEGFRFVFIEQPAILRLMGMATLYNLGTSALVFVLPILATQSLRAGPVAMGAIWSSLGIGMLLATLWLAGRRQEAHPERFRLVAVSLALGGCCVLLLSVSQTALLSAAAVLVIGGSTSVFTPIVWGLLQEATPKPLLGRVFTTFSTGGMSSAMAGMAAVGWTTDAWGVWPALAGIAAAMLATAAVAIFASQECRDRRRPGMALALP